jgi:segregation and condensation protein B
MNADPVGTADVDLEDLEHAAVEQGEPMSGAAEDVLADLSLAPALEAVLMIVDEPVSALDLAQALRRPTDDVVAELRVLSDDYSTAGRGFELREVAGGWRFYSAAPYAAVVEQFVVEGQQARLTQAALETLAVVAYRQPVSRARISGVRGVNVDSVIRTLTNRGLIEEAGTDPEHGAILYRTTPYFLERLGLTSLEELPPLAPHLPDLEALDSEL